MIEQMIGCFRWRRQAGNLKSARLVIAVGLLATGVVFAQDEVEPEGQALYGVTLGSINASSKIWVNSIPLFESEAEAPRTLTQQINRLLRQGENRILIHIEDAQSLPGEEQPGEETASAFIRAQIERLSPGAEEEDIFLKYDRQYLFEEDPGTEGQEIVEMERPDGPGVELRNRLRGKQSDFTYDVSQEEVRHRIRDDIAQSRAEIVFMLSDVPLTVLPWDGPFVAPDATATQEIKDKVVALRNLFADRELALILDALDHKLTHMAASVAVPVADLRSALAGAYTDMLFTIAGLQFVPLAAADLELKPLEGLNLIEVTRSGAPPIVAEGTDYLFRLRVFFTIKDGNWVLIE